MARGDEKVQAPLIRSVSPQDVMGSMVATGNDTVYLKAAKRINLRSSHHKRKKIITMCSDGW